MEIDNPCIKCAGSCCSLEVDISRDEYNKFIKIGLENNLTKNISKFIIEYPEFKEKENDLDEMYENEYAVLKSGEDGYCMFLNRKTRMCKIYNERPDTCKNFSNKSNDCKKIKKCIA